MKIISDAIYYLTKRNTMQRGKRKKAVNILQIVMCISFFIFCLFAPASSFAGKTISYTNDATSNEPLRNAPTWSYPVPRTNALYAVDTDNTTPLASENVVIVNFTPGSSGITTPSYVFGGLSQTKVWDNEVFIENGSRVAGSVYGGLVRNTTGSSDLVTALDNSVNISSSTITNYVYGGYAETPSGSAEASDNMLTVSTNSEVGGIAYGGYAISTFVGGSATSDNNTVTITDSRFTSSTGHLYGGYAISNYGFATAFENEITVDKSELRTIWGGYARTSSNSSEIIALADNNSVTVTNSTVRNVFGGEAETGYGSNALAIADNNSVTITNSTVTGEVYSGLATSGTGMAINNTLSITDSTVGDIRCGSVENTYSSAVSRNNIMSISNTRVTYAVIGGNAHSWQSNVTASENSVTVTNKSLVTTGQIIGGYANTYGGDTIATASSNSVTVSDNSTANEVFGGYARNWSAASATVMVSNNSVDIDNSSVTDKIFGGYALIYEPYDPPNSSTITASENSVTITNNSTVAATIYGGYAYNYNGVSATASENNVIIDNGTGTISGTVYGGWAYCPYGSATVSKSNITITDSTLTSPMILGGYALGYYGSATVSKSSVIIDNSILSATVYGGYAWGRASGEATASKNTVTLTNSTADSVLGGHAFNEGSEEATASKNTVTLTNSTADSVFGGDASTTGSGDATASKNTVTLTNSTADSILGGHASTDSGDATASKNTVTLTNSTANAYGGRSISGGDATASKNTVTVTNSTASAVFGGDATGYFGDATASKNTVTVTNSTADWVTGGYATTNDGVTTASKNTVVFKGSTASEIYGGHAENGGVNTASKNKISLIKNEIITDDGAVTQIYGGYANSYDGESTASENTVTFIKNTLDTEGSLSVFGGYAVSNEDNATASNNNLILKKTNSSLATSDGNTGTSAFSGGWAFSNSASATVTASNNSVSITKSTIDSGSAYYSNLIYGGFAQSLDGTVTASNNSVTIENSTISGYIYGGQAVIGIPGDDTGLATASNNSIIIENSDVSGVIYAGFAHAYSQPTNSSNNRIDITNSTIAGEVSAAGSMLGENRENSITIWGENDLTEAKLFANVWYHPTWRTNDNTLNFFGFRGTVKEIYDFQNYNFYLPPGLEVGDSLVTVSQYSIDMSRTESGEQTIRIGILMDIESELYYPGDYVYLINAEATGMPLDTSGIAQIDTGEPITVSTPFVTYDWILDNVDGNKLRARLLKDDLTPESGSLLQPPIGSLAFLSQASDFISVGLFQVMDVTKNLPCSWVPFGAVGGGYSRYRSGSHTDVYGGNLLVGFGRRTPVETGSFLLAVFAETGLGGYRGENDSTSDSAMSSKGDLRYYGGGLFARYDISQFYMDAAVRFGSTHIGYRTTDIPSPNYEQTTYDTDTLYYGAQAGIGYDAKISDCSGFELYARYYWLHQKGKDIAVLVDRVRIEDANSHRVKAGAKFYHVASSTLTPYIGAGYEYEFDGSLKGTVNGIDIPYLSLKGGSGFGELGLRFIPIDEISKHLQLDFNVTGHIGTRSGVTGTLKFKYEF